MPTVSTRMTSKPAASHSSMHSRVLAATPPSGPAGGGGGRLWAGGGPPAPALAGAARPAGAGRRGIDRQHSDFVTAPRQIGPERIDGGRLADARRPGDADADGAPGQRQQFLHQLPRGLVIVRPFGFDQRDGARNKRAVARPDAVQQASKIVAARFHALAPGPGRAVAPARPANKGPARPVRPSVRVAADGERRRVSGTDSDILKTSLFSKRCHFA